MFVSWADDKIRLQKSNVSVSHSCLLTCSRVLFQPVNLRLPASKILTRTSTSKLSYLRYSISYFKETITTSFKKVENTTLFKVLRNGFNVPGTPFEAIFAPQTTDTTSIEGSSLENPIRLPGVKVDHFRSFLRNLYPLCVLVILSVKYSRV